MVMIFLSYAKEESVCAEQIHQELEARGYEVWRDPPLLGLQLVLSSRTMENVILSSAAVVLLWSVAAAQSEWVERNILFAQQLKKLIVPVLLDSTALPATLVAVSPIVSQGSCSDVVTPLLARLPPVNSTDALFAISKQAGHEFLRERKAAIEQAAQMLQRGEQREAVLALLEYLAHNDLMTSVREKAQEVLAASNGGFAPATTVSPGESRHVFGVRCKSGHISYFDKRHVCKTTQPELRGLLHRAGKELDELHLACDTCGVEVVARVYCEDYR